LPERNARSQRDAEKDDDSGTLFQGVLSWSETVGSDGRSTESFELTDRTLNHPSKLIEAVPVILSATSDDRLDALCMQGVAGRLAAVSAICEEDIRMTVQPASLTRNTWGVGDCLQDLSAIAGIRQRGVDDKRHAVSVHDESVLCPQFPGVNKAWASGIAAAECADQDAVDDRQLGFKDAGLLELCGKVNVEIVPDPSFVPSSKSAVSGAARTAEFEWHVLLTASGHKYVPENLDHREVRNQRLATFRPDGLLRRQQGLQLRDEGIRWPSTCHPGSLRESRRP